MLYFTMAIKIWVFPIYVAAILHLCHYIYHYGSPINDLMPYGGIIYSPPLVMHFYASIIIVGHANMKPHRPPVVSFSLWQLMQDI